MQLSKEMYARKRIHNGCLVQTEYSIPRDNFRQCLASLRKLRDAKHFTLVMEFSIRTSQPLKILIIC